MKSIVCFTINVLSILPAIAQIDVSGKISDAETKGNVEFVTVSVKDKNLGTYTDSLGNFMLRNCGEDDTLNIKHIAYKYASIPVTFFLQKNTFFIIPETTLLNDVTITPKKNKNFKLGCTNCDANSSIRSFKGYEVVTLIEGQKNPENSYIKEIRFCIEKEKDVSYFIRTHLYENDYNKPGSEIKYSNLHFIQETKRMISVDISNYRIPFPSDGLFVGIEWLGLEPETDSENGAPVCPGILITQSKGITFYRSWGLPWEHLSELIGKPKVNASIGLTLIK